MRTSITLIIFLLALVACQPAIQPSVLPVAMVESISPTPEPIPQIGITKLPTPNITISEASPTALPAMVLPSMDDLASPTPTNTATPAPTSTASPTPEPTFTPPALPGTSSNEHYWMRRPVPEGSSVWTDKFYPYGSTRGGTLRPHTGVEFNVPTGTPILAAASGTVVVAGSDLETVYGEFPDFYGNLVVIEHESLYRGQPVYTLYGHVSEVQVVVGQFVQATQQIALGGGTGVADGAHLHFEVRVGSNTYNSTRNPSLWLYPFNDNGSVAGRVVRPNGSLVYEAPVSITRIDAPSRYRATTTYAEGNINGDDGWRENFALDDIPAGYYLLQVTEGNKKYKVETWVYEYNTSIVEIVIGNPSE